MSSQRRKMMQPWPLCIMPIYKNKDRSILPKFYTRRPSLARSSTGSSSLSQDCASNTTLLTNTSPFNSQQALITEKGKNKTNNSQQSHYYAENLRHENGLRSSQVYNPLSKDLGDYKQLEPLVAKDRLPGQDTHLLMDSQLQMEEKGFDPLEKSSFNEEKKEKISIFRYTSQVSLKQLIKNF